MFRSISFTFGRELFRVKITLGNTSVLSCNSPAETTTWHNTGWRHKWVFGFFTLRAEDNTGIPVWFPISIYNQEKY